MASNLKSQIVLFIMMSLVSSITYSQSEIGTWQLQLALGINNPIDDGKNDGYYSKYINFPSLNIGLQHIYAKNLGAKLDLGYNRSVNGEDSFEFKLNYTRINAQLAYDFTDIFPFIPERFRTVVHAGPGISFTKPLGNFSENKYTFLNVLAGMELHYGISESFSVYADMSYALSLSNKDIYNPNIDGFSFNGDLMYVSIGVSVSLSNNCFCN
ncbi:cell envelope biogenesis protein OmpA [Confluentibacter sediminis]|uniref:cell envelope biogenesis protein OmpA n=1 Tax=Confluentibacter sediminis TaxID=2219045 RepID=UPI0013A6B84C|nr:cell envelope biogenesis protein OmpA [Confluentibacter sediminis]